MLPHCKLLTQERTTCGWEPKLSNSRLIPIERVMGAGFLALSVKATGQIFQLVRSFYHTIYISRVCPLSEHWHLIVYSICYLLLHLRFRCWHEPLRGVSINVIRLKTMRQDTCRFWRNDKHMLFYGKLPVFHRNFVCLAVVKNTWTFSSSIGISISTSHVSQNDHCNALSKSLS